MLIISFCAYGLTLFVFSMAIREIYLREKRRNIARELRERERKNEK